jgi:hypothetical protein
LPESFPAGACLHFRQQPASNPQIAAVRPSSGPRQGYALCLDACRLVPSDKLLLDPGAFPLRWMRHASLFQAGGLSLSSRPAARSTSTSAASASFSTGEYGPHGQYFRSFRA